MPIRNRPRSFNRSPPNRSWTGSASTAGIAVAGNTKVLIATFVLSNPNIDETILRTVGLLAVKSDQTTADEEQIGALGFIIVNDLAVAAGVASIPGPITDRGDDGWFVYVPIAQAFNFESGIGVNPNMSTQYPFDSKAKRKIQEGSQVAVVVENAHATSAFTMTIVFRQLTMVRGT